MRQRSEVVEREEGGNGRDRTVGDETSRTGVSNGASGQVTKEGCSGDEDCDEDCEDERRDPGGDLVGGEVEMGFGFVHFDGFGREEEEDPYAV